MKTIIVVKLNRGAWMDYREQLIKKFNADHTLESYSDEFVKTKDEQYLVKIIPVNPNFLDPLLGHEGQADATDMYRFLQAMIKKVEQYMPAVPHQTENSVPTPPASAETEQKQPEPMPEGSSEASKMAPENDLKVGNGETIAPQAPRGK